MNGPAAIAERPPSEAVGPDLERLKFRFGFLCLRADRAYRLGPEEVLPKAGWRLERAGPFAIHLHPETRLLRHSAGDRHLLLLGEAFDVATGAAPALAPLLAADEAGFFDALDRLSGRFALLLAEGDRLRAFHDPIGSRSVFYHSGEPFCLGSHAPLVARAVKAGRREDIPPLLADPGYRARKVKYLPGDWTIYRNVFGLVPNNLYDSSLGETRRYWPRAPLRPGTVDGFLGAATAYLRAQAAFAGREFRPVFGLTGGVDTRAVFASFRASGVPFETMTWLDDRLAPGELATVEALAAHLGVPHRGIRRKPGTDEVARIAARNGGAFRAPARFTSAMLEAYGGAHARIFVRCWGGEVMRGFYNTRRRPMLSLAPGEMARAYCMSGREVRPVAAALGAFEEFFRRGNYAGLDGLGYDPNDLFYWEHRMGMWASGVNNEVDPAMPTLIGLNGRPMFAAAFGLPPEQRLTKRLLLELTDRFDPVLARMALAPGSPKNDVSLAAAALESAPSLFDRLRRRLRL